MASAVKGSKELDEQQDEALAEETETLDVADGDLESNDSKLKTLLGILKKVIGVKDLANMRLSLPANLMEPVGNLESWHYCDRPDLFAAVGDRDIDALTRFIAVVRWILTKDLRYVRTRISKPYNSALGERFRCAWEVAPASASDFTVYQNLYNGPSEQFSTPNASPALTATGSPLAGAKKLSLPKSISNLSLDDPNAAPTSPSAPNRKQFGGLASSASSMTDTDSLVTPSPPSGSTKVAYVTEQICHHPPISAFWYETTSDDQRASVQASGIDQIAAKFNGTSIKIAPGSQNKGIFVKVPDVSADTEYHITHPVGYLTGFLSRAPYATLAETTYVNTLKNGKKEAKSYCAILTYAEESWISKPKFLIDGLIYEVPDGTKEYSRIKDVPSSAVAATIKGTWRGKISIKRTKGEKSESTLVDVSKLDIVPKSVRPLDKQDPMESRKFWDSVSVAIRKKDYKLATTHKQTIEQRQRDIAAERTKTNEEFVPVFFDPDISSGRAKLTSAGQKAVKDELELVDRKR